MAYFRFTGVRAFWVNDLSLMASASAHRQNKSTPIWFEVLFSFTGLGGALVVPPDTLTISWTCPTWFTILPALAK